jgi:hypothetical protein
MLRPHPPQPKLKISMDTPESTEALLHNVYKRYMISRMLPWKPPSRWTLYRVRSMAFVSENMLTET